MNIFPINAQTKLTVHAKGYVRDTIPEIDTNRRRPTIIIRLGGGWHRLSPRESEHVAIELITLGYQAFLLLYSTDAESFFPKQLLQLDHLVRYVRKHATEFSVNLNKIIVTGFQPVFNYLLI